MKGWSELERRKCDDERVCLLKERLRCRSSWETSTHVVILDRVPSFENTMSRVSSLKMVR